MKRLTPLPGLLAALAALLLGACASGANTYDETDDAGNGTVEDAEATGFVISEFGAVTIQTIAGSWSGSSDADFFRVELDGQPTIDVDTWTTGVTVAASAWPLNIHLIDESGSVTRTIEHASGGVVLDGVEAVFEVYASAEEGLTSGEYEITWNNLASE